MNNPLLIRNASVRDAEALAGIYNHYVTNTQFTFDLETFSVDDRRQWLAGYNENPMHRLLIGEVEGEVIGYASSSLFRPKPAYYRSVETTIYLTPGTQGNGYGAQLYSALLRELEGTGINRCYGIIALPNDASVALHRSLGYTEAGHLTKVGYKFDRYWDTLWMEKPMPS